MSDMELKLPILFRPKEHIDDMDFPYERCDIRPMTFYTIDNVDEEIENGKAYARFSSGGDLFVCNFDRETLVQQIREAKVQYVRNMNYQLNRNV